MRSAPPLFTRIAFTLCAATVSAPVTMPLLSPQLLEDVAEETANASIGDLNGDGHPDIVLAKGRHQPAKDVVLEAPGLLFGNDGTGRHYTRMVFGDNKGAIYGFAVGDMDGDGVPDLVAARSGAPSIVFSIDS